jgi:hypothetical protein
MPVLYRFAAAKVSAKTDGPITKPQKLKAEIPACMKHLIELVLSAGLHEQEIETQLLCF